MTQELTTVNMRRMALDIFDAAIAAADPAVFLKGRFPPPLAGGRLFLIGAGKAAASMVSAAENHYLDLLGIRPAQIAGLAITRHGYGCRTRVVPVIESGHPVPDIFGIAGTEKLLELASTATKDDMAVILISGGGSANLIAPAGKISLTEKQMLTSALLRSGAPIDVLNCIRKHISRIKGGRLAAALAPAQITTLAISDVPGDDLSLIASGPTVPDPTTLADARALLEKYEIQVPASITAALADPLNETPKAGDEIFRNTRTEIVLRPSDSVKAACDHARKLGFEVINLGPNVTGEARDMAMQHAAMAIDLKRQNRRAAIISGGELTVTIKGTGRGGPNQEYMLASAIALNEERGIVAMAGDSDGTDGGIGNPSDPAGAIIDPRTLVRARVNGIDAAARLKDNDSTRFFDAVGDLIVTGPTRTNANDIRVFLVNPSPLD